MDETGSQKDAALSLSGGGPLRQVRDPGGLESEGLTLRSGSILRGRSPHTSQISDTQASLESSVTAAQDQSVLSQSESQPALIHTVSTAERRADLSVASLPGDVVQPKVPASVSSVVTASLAMSSVTGSLASSLAPVEVSSSFTPVGGVLSSMLSARESRSAAELERMHTGLGALPCAAEFGKRPDIEEVISFSSCGGAMRSHDDDELTVHNDDASSDSRDETIELSPQATVRGSVAGHTGPPAMATSSYYDLSLAASGPSMTVTSRWVDEQRERTPPVRSAFSAIGLPSVTCERTMSPNSLRCDEEMARLSEAATSPPRPRTLSAPDSPSRCHASVPVGEFQHRTPHRPLVLGLTPRLICRRVHSPAYRHRCLDVAGLLNRLVDRQHDDLQQARADANQREQSARAEVKAEAAHREQQLKAEAEQREQRAYQREQAAKAEASQREERAYQREKEARAEAKAEAKAEVLRREKQVRSEVEKEMEIDRLRRKLANKEAKERQPQLSSASHLVGAPTPTGVGPTEEVLVAVLNREMDRRRLEEEQRAIEARHEQQLEVERLRRQSKESTELRLEMPPTVTLESSVDTRPSGLTASQEQRVVDEYYVRGVQSPQASTILETLGIDSQDSQGVTTSAGSAFVVISPGVSTQSTPAKPSVAPMQLDTQSRLVQ